MPRIKKEDYPTYQDYFDWKSSCKRSGNEVDITMQDWIQWWNDSGLWSQRGRGRLDYCMGRIDVQKPFSLDNIVAIQVKDQNYAKKKKKI